MFFGVRMKAWDIVDFRILDFRRGGEIDFDFREKWEFGLLDYCC